MSRIIKPEIKLEKHHPDLYRIYTPFFFPKATHSIENHKKLMKAAAKDGLILENVIESTLEIEFSNKFLPIACRQSESFTTFMPDHLTGLCQEGGVTGHVRLRYEYDKLFKEQIPFINKYFNSFGSEPNKENKMPFFIYQPIEYLGKYATSYINNWNGNILVLAQLKAEFGETAISQLFSKKVKSHYGAAGKYFTQNNFSVLTKELFILDILKEEANVDVLTAADLFSRAYEELANVTGEHPLTENNYQITKELEVFERKLHEAYSRTNNNFPTNQSFSWRTGLYHGIVRAICNSYVNENMQDRASNLLYHSLEQIENAKNTCDIRPSERELINIVTSDLEERCAAPALSK